MKIDTAWFLSKIQQSRYGSGRQVAEAMKLDQSFLSRSVSGNRVFSLEELELFAKLVEVPILEVLIHAGLNVRSELDALEYYAKGGADGGKKARSALRKG